MPLHPEYRWLPRRIAPSALNLPAVDSNRERRSRQRKAAVTPGAARTSCILRLVMAFVGSLRAPRLVRGLCYRALHLFACSPHGPASIRFLFVAPALCFRLPSDSRSPGKPLPSANLPMSAV